MNKVCFKMRSIYNEQKDKKFNKWKNNYEWRLWGDMW